MAHDLRLITIGIAASFLFLSCGEYKRPVTDLFPVRTGRQYGYIDRSGKTVINPRFFKAGCFTDGSAIVATTDSNARWGFIDRTGNYIVDAIYAGATSFSEGLAFVVEDSSAIMAIDGKGMVRFVLNEAAGAERFSEGLAAYSTLGPEGESWGFVDQKGATVIAPQFRAVSYFSGRRCGVMNEKGMWGYVDKKGSLVIGCQYDNVQPFTGKRAKVSMHGKWGVIDDEGKQLIAPQFDDMDIDGGHYLVKKGDKWGWISNNGEEVIPVQFDDAFPFKGNRYAAVRQGYKWGYIDEGGRMTIHPRYEFAFGFDGDMALVQIDKKYGFIDKDGNYAVSPAYDNISLDYLIRYFAKTSAFYSLQSNKNDPSIVSWKWLNDFYHLEYKEAREISTDDTRAMLDAFSGFSEDIADSSKQRMMGVIVGIKGCRTDGSRAIVTYTLSDNPGKDQLLFLEQKNGKWLVHFTDNGKNAEGAARHENGNNGR
jgi:hypothetical protein